MLELEAGLADLVAGRGGLFLVTGEPGIGKTRLADEFGRSAAARGVGVHWGRAWEAGGAPSYWPFTQALRSMCRGLDAEAVGALVGIHGVALAELMPELRHWIPGLAFAPAQDNLDRFALFDAVGTFLHAIARRSPQLVLLDDLHAADPSSLLLLQFLVRDLRSVPLLVLGTYRDAEARLATEVGRTLATIAREATALPLRRLDRREVADFVAQVTGDAPSDDRVEAIHQRTEGNPLFLRELLRLQPSTARAPDGIRAVVRERLSLLTPAVRRVLEAAAVLGREFALDPLAVVAETTERELGSVLAPAADAGIVEPLDQAGRWRFTHVLLREGLYDDLSPARRSALHAVAAAELRRRAGGPPLAELAHHLLHAIPDVGVGDAADAALEAAGRAIHLLAFEDAAAMLARTAKLLDGVTGEDRRRFDVQLGLGVARIRAGEIHVGKQTCLAAADIARRLGDGELLARAVLGSAVEFVSGVRDRALIALLEEALAALPAGDGALRARCMAQLAAERQPEPDTQGPVELARDAVAMARRVGDVDTLRFTLSHAGLAMLIYADPAERQVLDQECLRLALAAGDKVLTVRAHLLLQSGCWELGDRAGAEAHARAYEELLRLRHSGFRWMTLGLQASRAMWAGRFDEAARAHREALQIWREDQGRGSEMMAFPVGFARAAERYDDLPGIEARVRADLASLQDELTSFIAEMLIAQLHARGDRRRAATQLAAVKAHPLFAEVREASWLALLVDACHVLGDVALAERLYPLLLPRAHRFFFLGPIAMCDEPPYARQLGLLAETLGRLDDAVAHLTEAEAATVRSGPRSHLARLRWELAGALLHRGGPGDRERAVGLLVEARSLAEELGQMSLVPIVQARLAEAAGEQGKGHEEVQASSAGHHFELRREGEYWTIASSGRTLRLRDSRGLQMLDRLVSNAGQELHVLQLASAGDEPGGDAGDAGEMLDAEAVQSYRRRLLDLREELEEAEGFADAGRAERARDEIEALTQELARAVGLGGRARRAGGAAERARTAVQKRLRAAVRRIEEGLPELGRHLDQTIRTGMFCGYLPDGRRRGRRS